jgi:hypothetical protein
MNTYLLKNTGESRKQAISNSITNVLWRFLSIEAMMFSPDHIQLRAEPRTNESLQKPPGHPRPRKQILTSKAANFMLHWIARAAKLSPKNRQEARDQITWIRVSRGSKSANCPRGSDDLRKEQKKKKRLGVFLRGTGEKRKKFL